MAATNDRQNLPVSHSYIADALAAHHYYLDQIIHWYDWLEDKKEPENALCLILFKLINETIKRRDPGGAWFNVEEKYIPTSADLKESLDSDKYNGFKQQIETLRIPIEEAALALVSILQSDKFLAEMDKLPYDEQLLYASKLADHLAVSNVGLFYLRSCINAPLQSPMPLFLPDRLLKKEGSFSSSDFPIMRRASRVYAEVFIKLAPALISDANYTKFSDAALDFIAKYFPDDVLNALTLEEKISDIKQYLKNNPLYLERYGQPVAATIFVFFEIVNVYLAFRKVQDDPSIRGTLGFLRAIASLTSALSSAQKVFQRFQILSLSNSQVIGLNVITGIYDVIIGMVDSHNAWRTGDISVAAGNVLQGVGLASAAAISTWSALTAAEVLAPSAGLNPLAGSLLTLGAFLTTFTGTFIIVYTKDSPFERWIKNNYFGEHWNDVAPDEGPQDVLFGFKYVDGHPNLARQISEYLSMFYPVKLSATRGASHSVMVSLQPELAYHESSIIVKRIADRGELSSQPRYVSVPLYMKPANAIDDKAYALPAIPRESDKLSDWIRPFSPDELSQDTNPNFDPTGMYLEVDVSIPDKLQPALGSIVLDHPQSDILSNFPFLLRARVRVE